MPLVLFLAAVLTFADDSALNRVLTQETQRVAVIARAAPSVVSIFDSGQHGGGSGILIDADGYGVTNFHVVAGLLDSRRGLGGLSDGHLYDLEVLGIDPTGDVAMFRLTGRDAFPFSPLSDSDVVRVGDTAIAMGNPFVLAEDFAPTVTLGIVTGVHRYQWGVGGNLVYSDCIQTDTSINPGNSGGPLFNEAGEVIGINGRISVNTRGRFNVGFGYAITTNQIRRFMPALRAGLLAKHGTLQATVSESEAGGLEFARIVPRGSADDAGVLTGDPLLAVDGVRLTSPNHFASLIGVYPGDWRVLLDFQRGAEHWQTLASLDPITPKLPKPFLPDRETNLRQVRRVLREYQAAMLSGAERPPDRRWRWTARRNYGINMDPRRKGPTCFEAQMTSAGPIGMRQYDADGSARRIIEYDDAIARQRTSEEDEAYDLPAELGMIWNALYLVQQRLLFAPDELDLTNVAHAGGDVVIRATEGSGFEPQSLSEYRCRAEGMRRVLDSPGTSRREVEVLVWPLARHVVARLGFDVVTHEIIQVDLRDVPSGVCARIFLGGYQDVGGVRRACDIEVLGPNVLYVDHLSDWEVAP